MKQKVEIILPPKIYICASRENQTVQTDKEEYNIFFKNVIQPYSDDYDVVVNCCCGENLGNCWHIAQFPETGSKFTVELKVYNAYGECLADGKTEAEIVEKKRSDAPFRVLSVGDSMTQGAAYLRHLASKLYGLEFTGSRSFNGWLYHEGRGGWSFENYFHNTREKGGVPSPFLFPKGVPGEAYFGDLGYYRDIADKTHDPYRFDGYREEKPAEGQFVSNQDKLYRYAGGGLTLAEETITWEFSFSKYVGRRGISGLDAVTVLMGANDLQICPYEESDRRIGTYMDYMARFIQSVREYEKTLTIVINLPVLGAEQHAWGKQLGCRGTQKMYRFNILRAVKMLIETYGNRETEHIYLSPMYLNLDPDYGFPKEGYRVNQYAADVVQRQSNWVHPNEHGYCQMGDVLGGVLEKIRG